MQHRGQESCGIITGDNYQVRQHKGLGLVPDVFNQPVLDSLSGHLAIGHVRYSTTGSTLMRNAQPFVVHHGGETLAIGHNGNLVNAQELRHRLEQEGSIFQSTMDTEVIVHLMARHFREGLVEALTAALTEVRGAYSLVLATKDKVIGVRDPNGFRPLCLGKLNGALVLASETCALDLVQAEYLRDVEPGEIVVLDENGLTSYKTLPPAPKKFCIFEFVYFARPDSLVFGQNVYQIRKRLGLAIGQRTSG